MKTTVIGKEYARYSLAIPKDDEIVFVNSCNLQRLKNIKDSYYKDNDKCYIIDNYERKFID